MPEAVTVWMVELSPGPAGQERRGTLGLQPDVITFVPSDGSEDVRIPLARVRKARRLRGSPVLVVTHDAGGRAVRTAFYFAQPPPLEELRGEGAERPAPLGFRKSSRRRARRQNIGYLGTWNRQLKADIEEWEQEIRDAVGGRR
ncbi:MAG TPA: hypothetical protein VK977_03410 [Actinomycetota bacterium]|nr:hypothetical protein [Actinomycetota bacterium]